jgi:hypothetical protein
MIQEIDSFEKYEDFIAEMAAHPLYSDPHYTHNRNNLYSSLERDDEFAFAVLNDGRTEGIFNWLVLHEDRFIEMIIGFTRKEEAFSEMLSFVEQKYPDFSIDFVFNPDNAAISGPLRARGAVFDPEQQKMLYTGRASGVLTECIEVYSDKWREQYCRLHRKEAYWNAERVLSAPERFRVLLALRDGELQGYLDVTRCFEENEIYDLFVKDESAGEAYALALLAKAAELNKPKKLMVLANMDDKKETDLYSAAGFDWVDGTSSVLAQIKK